MNLDRAINSTVAELYRRPSIPCARAGRQVLEQECSGLVLASDEAQLQMCLACPEGHKRAKASPWPARHLLPLPVVAIAAPVRTAPTRPRKERQLTLPVSPARVEAPAQQSLGPNLDELARVLRELTSDGRMRVSMLDVQRTLRAPSYDAAAALVQLAGLRTSRLYGPVQSVLVDHKMRQLLDSAAASEVRQ